MYKPESDICSYRTDTCSTYVYMPCNVTVLRRKIRIIKETAMIEELEVVKYWSTDQTIWRNGAGKYLKWFQEVQ